MTYNPLRACVTRTAPLLIPLLFLLISALFGIMRLDKENLLSIYSFHIILVKGA
jgi:hypothetical protein